MKTKEELIRTTPRNLANNYVWHQDKCGQFRLDYPQMTRLWYNSKMYCLNNSNYNGLQTRSMTTWITCGAYDLTLSV